MKNLKKLNIMKLFKSDKWEDVKLILRNEVKKDGFKWQYADRLFDHLKSKMSAIEAIQLIKQLRSQGKKDVKDNVLLKLEEIKELSYNYETNIMTIHLVHKKAI